MKINIQKKEIQLPALRFYETFEEEKWLFGVDEILNWLIKRRMLDSDFLNKNPWALEGEQFIKKEIQPVLNFIFQYPIVLSSASF